MSGISPSHQQTDTISGNPVPTTTHVRCCSAQAMTNTSPGSTRDSAASRLVTQPHPPGASGLCTRHGKKPNWDPTTPARLPVVVSLHQQKDLRSPHRGTLEPTTLVTRKECTAGNHKTSPTKGHSPRSGNVTTYRIHRSQNNKLGKMRQQRNVFQMKEPGEE